MRKIYFCLLLFISAYVKAQIVNIPDAAFKNMLLQADVDNEIANNLKIDANNDGEIQVEEALSVVTLSVASDQIANLEGLGSFSNVLFLTVGGNLQLTEVDLGNLHNLVSVTCNGTGISTLDFSQTKVKYFVVNNNPQLQTLLIKNGVRSQNTFPIGIGSMVNFSGNPSLSYICVDESEAGFIQIQANQAAPGVSVNSYCSFIPGGVIYSITGTNRFDATSDGCDTNDLPYKQIKINVSNGDTDTDTYISPEGDYSVYMGGGDYTLTPLLENPAYFTVTPASLTASFPADSSPVSADFCVTANGVKHDVDVTVVPINVAIPGFPVKYRIICRNIGNQPAYGTLQFTYDGSVMALANAGGGVSSPGSLTFTYDGYPITTTWEYNVEFVLNTPTANPPLNSGDVLTFTATMTGSMGTDENQEDNTFTLHQTVFNSMDPNDKTCLEGTTIDPSMAGKYVHYLIRFENTGTANAQNIVVKDVIDTTKYDVSSLIPLDGSHPFTTRITSTNKVEFIFENIQLPFDDANNDGFVVFKIKTKPTLVAGNTFSNAASIYFDYNAPIVTNTATTTLQALGASDFDFDRYFTIWPNPTSDILHIEGTSEVRSAEVYDLRGRLITTFVNTHDIDVAPWPQELTC